MLLVEDVVDTGLTLNYLCKLFELRKPASLRVATLLDRPYRRLVENLRSTTSASPSRTSSSSATDSTSTSAGATCPSFVSPKFRQA